GCRLRPQQVVVVIVRHLVDVTLVDSRIAFLEEMDLDVVDAVEETGQTADLLLGGGPECVREFDVPPANADVHLSRSVGLRRSRRRGPTREAIGRLPRLWAWV